MRSSAAGDGSATSSIDVPRPTSTAKLEELGLYLDGLKALRQTHDFRGAQGLLERYREAYPFGAFVEESWALSIETASDLGKSPREVAASYLERYPHGRFRALAREALKR